MTMHLLEEGQYLGVAPNNAKDVVPGYKEAAEQQRNELKIRARAAELETDGNQRNDNTTRHPVKVRMPSGQVITVGGEALVMALSHGGKAVE